MTNAPLAVRPVTSGREKSTFIRLPATLYARDPLFVPELTQSVRKKLNPNKNPFFKESRAALFLAYRGKTPVGRISAHWFKGALERFQDNTGHFGFLAAEDDAETVAALLDAAEAWVRGEGLTRITGPFSFTINDECGLLVDGHAIPPMIMMGQDPKYLAAHVEAAGYTGIKDLLYFRTAFDGEHLPKRLSRLAERVPLPEGMTIRQGRPKDPLAEARVIFGLFNEAWVDNWGFVPFNDDEIAFLAKELGPVMEARRIFVVEKDGAPIGMFAAVADHNRTMAGIAPDPSPLGWLRLAGRMMFKIPDDIRVILMGVSPRLEGALARQAVYAAMISAVYESHMGTPTTFEMGWVLEDNREGIAACQVVGGERSKTYRIFEKALT